MSTLPTPHHFEKRVPEGDDRTRDVCGKCGFIDYQNPKIIVGAVPRFGEKILLCRRAIEPRHGYWTIPAGFMEQGESAEEGALREAYEEATVRLKIDGLLAIYSIPHISQVQLIYRTTLVDAHFAPGIESLEVALFDWDDIPWDELAFPSVKWALEQAREVWDGEPHSPFGNPEI